MKKDDIKKFVRNILGCGCPEEVFDIIEHENNITINDVITINHKINIGNKLLIYLIKVNDAEFLDKYLAEVFYSGKDERDDRGFNRLRLGIITDNNELMQLAEDIRSDLPGLDDKVHLHPISTHEYNTLLGK